MSKIISKEIHLFSRPDGEPKRENFQLVENEINGIQEDEVLVKNFQLKLIFFLTYNSCINYFNLFTTYKIINFLIF